MIFFSHYFSIAYQKRLPEILLRRYLRVRAHALSECLPRRSEVIWMKASACYIDNCFAMTLLPDREYRTYKAGILRSDISECSNRLLDSSNISTYPTHHERRLEWDDAHRRAIVFAWANHLSETDRFQRYGKMTKPIYQSQNYTIDYFGKEHMTKSMLN